MIEVKAKRIQDTILALLNATTQQQFQQEFGISEGILSHLVSTHSLATAHLSEGTACWLSELYIPPQLTS